MAENKMPSISVAFANGVQTATISKTVADTVKDLYEGKYIDDETKSYIEAQENGKVSVAEVDDKNVNMDTNINNNYVYDSSNYVHNESSASVSASGKSTPMPTAHNAPPKPAEIAPSMSSIENEMPQIQEQEQQQEQQMEQGTIAPAGATKTRMNQKEEIARVHHKPVLGPGAPTKDQYKAEHHGLSEEQVRENAARVDHQHVTYETAAAEYMAKAEASMNGPSSSVNIDQQTAKLREENARVNHQHVDYSKPSEGSFDRMAALKEMMSDISTGSTAETGISYD